MHRLLKIATFFAGWLHCSLSVGQGVGTIQLGAGYSSEDSYRFGQYSGITSSGGFGVGGFSLQNTQNPEKSTYWSARAGDLGLETGNLSARYGDRGNYSLSLNFDQLPRYRFNDGATPFNGSGTVSQTLPGNWQGSERSSDFAVLSDSLKQVNIDTRRERYTGGFEWQLDRAWQLMGEFRHETKQGNETLGAIFGETGGNPRGSLVARPVDYQIDEVTLGISYANQTTQYNLSYGAMLFSNDDKALRFANPFNNEDWATGAGFDDGAIGKIGLEPDNKSYRLAFSGAHSLGGSTRLSGSVVSTTLEQDDSYLDYSSVFLADYPLPATDLDGKVDSLVGALSLSSRLGRKTSLRLRYNYRERENRSPQNSYQRIPGDAVPQEPLLSERTRINRIYDLQRSRYSADLTYRLGGRNRLSGGLELEETDRSMVDVATTDETTGYLKLDVAPTITTSGFIKLTRSSRDASTYDSTVPFVAGHNPDYVATLVGDEIFENDPFLRRYHLTDRERDEISGSVNFYPSDVVGLSLLAKTSRNDYPDAQLGITESEDTNFAADLSVSPAADWTLSLYYNYDQFENRNSGYQRRGGEPFYPQSVRDPQRNWTVTTKDRVHGLGTGIDWELLQGRLNLAMDASYTDAETQTRPFSADPAPSIPGSRADLPFPDVRTDILSFSLRGDYQLRPGRELSVRYYYEEYRSDDWAIDDVRVDSVPNMLLLGTQSFNYSAHLVVVSVLIDLD
jgi:MtrB/PioB family decaheme-associated outer membrane protein